MGEKQDTSISNGDYWEEWQVEKARGFPEKPLFAKQAECPGSTDLA